MRGVSTAANRRPSRHRMLYALAALATAMALTVVFAPSAFAHLYAYYGANYSFDFNNTTGVTICDQETDGDGAYVRYYRANSQYNSVSDANGSQPGCSSSTNGQGISPITQFRTCEDHAFASDGCGSWRYH
ncbi:MAG: hypothetical protein M3540_00555 [Actinomycetota bacterium]|nr:hypothetical protein [Actinomycetota bacterium]